MEQKLGKRQTVCAHQEKAFLEWKRETFADKPKLYVFMDLLWISVAVDDRKNLWKRASSSAEQKHFALRITATGPFPSGTVQTIPKTWRQRFTSFCWLCVWECLCDHCQFEKPVRACVWMWCVVVTIWAVCLSSVQASTERDRHVFPWQWAAVAPFVCVGTEVRMTKTTARAHTLKEAHRNNYVVLSLSLVWHPTPWKPAWCPAT